jgi:hypothetical protein
VAAPHQATVALNHLQWRYAPLDAEVACSSAVLEKIRRHAVESLSLLSRGGLETGGILLGRRSDRSVEIVGMLPIECEHKLGPLFILSAADEKSLDAALSSDKLGALQPVGLYVSHSRRDFAVGETDAKILDRLVPGPWQLVLVVMPAKIGPCRAGFFLRGSVDRSFVVAHEVSLSPLGRRPSPLAAATPITSSVASITPVTPLLRILNQAKAPATARQRLQSFLTQAQKQWRPSQWNLPTAIILFLMFIWAGGLWLNSPAAPAPLVPMHVSDLGSKLRIEWDPAHKAVRTASAAKLEIRDGGHSPVMIPISRSGLDNGSALYVPQSDNVEVRLKLMRGLRTESESVIFFINPSRLVPAPAQIVTAEPPLDAANPPAEIAPPQPRHLVNLEKPARKVFQLPENSTVNAIAPRAVIALPDLPDIHLNQASAPPAVPLVAALATEARVVGPPQLHSGHLIWTGSLKKNAVLSFSPEGASSGVLNGRLPGVPVTIMLQPAELTDSGIAVFSKDPDRSGAGEQPSNWNGWNVVVYHDWDPKKIAEVNIVEPPGPANNWKRVVLRNGNRSASVVVVNWQR